MSSWAKPGVKCVYIGNAGKGSMMVKGATYTVKSVASYKDAGGNVGIELWGVRPTHHPKYFRASCLRPLITRDQDIAMFKAICPGLPVVPPAVVPARVPSPTGSGLTEPACTGKFDG